jgi:hypothetical protein
MQASTLAFAFVLMAGAACAEQPQSAAVSAPTMTQPPAGGSASAPPQTQAQPPAAPPAPAPSLLSTSVGDAGTEAAASGGETATAPGPGATDAGAPAQYRSCTVDSDCVAVEKVGCCRNGWQEAVSTSQKEAYAKSFTCPQPHPICPMYIVHDTRVPLCDNGTHMCTMTRPEDVGCGGFIHNKHSCPAGYRCQLSKHPDVPGKCVQ